MATESGWFYVGLYVNQHTVRLTKLLTPTRRPCLQSTFLLCKVSDLWMPRTSHTLGADIIKQAVLVGLKLWRSLSFTLIYFKSKKNKKKSISKSRNPVIMFVSTHYYSDGEEMARVSAKYFWKFGGVWRSVWWLPVTNYCHKAQQIINKKPQNARLHSFSLRVVVGAAVTFHFILTGFVKTQDFWWRWNVKLLFISLLLTQNSVKTNQDIIGICYVLMVTLIAVFHIIL